MFYDDFNHCSAILRTAVGITPAPCSEREMVVAAAFSEILKICQAAGSDMLIVVLGSGPTPVRVPSSLENLGVPLARADRAMIQGLRVKSLEEYQKRYAHWRGDPPRLVDPHPNPQAHTIIAGCIYERLQGRAHDREGMSGSWSLTGSRAKQSAGRE